LGWRPDFDLYNHIYKKLRRMPGEVRADKRAVLLRIVQERDNRPDNLRMQEKGYKLWQSTRRKTIPED